jgi:hypothetical protein
MLGDPSEIEERSRTVAVVGEIENEELAERLAGSGVLCRLRDVLFQCVRTAVVQLALDLDGETNVVSISNHVDAAGSDVRSMPLPPGCGGASRASEWLSALNPLPFVPADSGCPAAIRMDTGRAG